MKYLISSALLIIFSATDTLSDNRQNIAIHITSGTITRPKIPQYLTRCALAARIANESTSDVDFMKIKIREHIEEISDLKSNTSQSIFLAGFFGECKNIIDTLEPQVITCRVGQSGVYKDCRDIVKFVVEPAVALPRSN